VLRTLGDNIHCQKNHLSMPKETLLVQPVEKPNQFVGSDLSAQLIELSSFIRAGEARERYGVSGKGFSVAVLDTGLRTTHIDFKGRVSHQVNFTADNKGYIGDATDGNGHGTNVGGIIVANGINTGLAPDANIIPVKVLDNRGGGNFEAIVKALEWVLENHEQHNITVVNLSLSNGKNYLTDLSFAQTSEVYRAFNDLYKKDIAVVVAAGNDFFKHKSEQGMAFPAIVKGCISVGAVYDASAGSFSYLSGARAFTSGAGRITPFSQRLHPNKGGLYRTDIFAPGAPVQSSGISSDRGISIQQGTSQAAPVVAGLVLLMQEYYSNIYNAMDPKTKGRLDPRPNVDQLTAWLRRGGISINDGDDEDDNVRNTGLDFIRVDAYDALRQVKLHFVRYFAFPD